VAWRGASDATRRRERGGPSRLEMMCALAAGCGVVARRGVRIQGVVDRVDAAKLMRGGLWRSFRKWWALGLPACRGTFASPRQT
jgi:hypothetical protein